ncbi:hypothetical protein QBC33DRAFT_573538 [Phialemonium atrogriseum]|uniref:Uncharacterized protein n=1 Tax=Phialemonium atrogriseum TaxID=1093897 RepID=A0AAJ0BTP6_9PEZI|nr:uncharacterized protein QBC33DRAFT_573538 [Phialemonium atrogriseum]KAK1763218.1 hypothetical protein QBC33DRAFT_573538 [Phialemonium atrogriseum]
MRTTAVLSVLMSTLGVTLGCSTTSGVQITFYGAPDNDPPGGATAHNCGGRNFIAGGTGTYADPLTFASSTSEYSVCEIIYVPYLKKYLRMEDDCAQCIDDWNNGNKKHIDIWTGTPSTNGGNAQIQCENALTPNGGQQVLRSPPNNLAVDSTALWSGNSCHTDHVFPGATQSCSGGGGGGGGCQTGCSWAGHCIGCPCQTFDDCSDNFICTNGACANP